MIKRLGRVLFLIAGITAVLVMVSTSIARAANDVAPTPRAAPRQPVVRQALANSKVEIPESRILTGRADVIDAERLKIGEADLRLFGVIAPQLSAPYGPQARVLLDRLADTGDMTCSIRDRDREGRFMVTCRSSDNTDLSLELLRRGLAVTARGSLHAGDLASSYEAAEKAAREQKMGLWSIALPQPATISVVKDASKPTEFITNSNAADDSETKKPVEKTATMPDAVVSPPIVSEPMFDDTAALLEIVAETSLVERYQPLIIALVVLLSALVVAAGILLRQRHKMQREVRTLSAALRGELMAARAVCIARLHQMTQAEDDNSIPWPRIRIAVFQAYLGRLGLLGSDMTRKIASVYGQASDCAAYYQTSGVSVNAALPALDVGTRRQSLSKLLDYIAEVLVNLEAIENGKKPVVPNIPKPEVPIPPASRAKKPSPVAAPLPSSPEVAPVAQKTTIANKPPSLRSWHTWLGKIKQLKKIIRTPQRKQPRLDYSDLQDNNLTEAELEAMMVESIAVMETDLPPVRKQKEK